MLITLDNSAPVKNILFLSGHNGASFVVSIALLFFIFPSKISSKTCSLKWKFTRKKVYERVHVSKAFENLKGCWWSSLDLNGISTQCL